MFKGWNEIKKIEVTVDGIVFQNSDNGFRVIRATRSDDEDGQITAVGKTPEIYEGQDLVLEGDRKSVV